MNLPMPAMSWYESSARQRVAALLDPGSFEEFLGPEARETSPHLHVFDLPVQFDDGIVVGRGVLDGRKVLVAAQEGRFMGGAFGEVHGAKLTGLLRAARDNPALPVLILFDTGGVRLQEANAGETAIAEIIRALIEARLAGAKVIGLIGGRAGCYGGGGIIAACCSALAVSEVGRIGVSGPEVIETNRGVEEFNSRDRPLVWRTQGGKHRYLLGAVAAFAEDSAESFRAKALELIAQAPGLDEGTLQADQARLQDRLDRFGAAGDALDIWRGLGIDDVEALSAMDAVEFLGLAGRGAR